jgi:alpha-amylase
MADVCFYFEVHQPIRLRRISVFDDVKSPVESYFDWEKNREIFLKVAEKCYYPATHMFLELLDEHKEMKLAFSLSGTFVEQAKAFAPDVIDLFKDVVKTGRAELLCETYYHSLSGLWEKQDEFKEQLELQRKTMEELFNVRPRVVRDTELIYDNRIARSVADLGFDAIITEGTEKILGWRSPNFLYNSKDKGLKVILKNYRLSDDIAFRFSNPSWNEYPLTAEKYANWIAKTPGDYIGLFMDYETFGEHQWRETGIFDFMRALPEQLMSRDVDFLTPSDVASYEPREPLDVPFAISWADVERDVSAWLDNEMQHECFNEIRDLEEAVKTKGDEELLRAWRLLQTSDHLYYICLKNFADAEVHAYFSPYDSPYRAFINYMNAIQDLKRKVYQ